MNNQLPVSIVIPFLNEKEGIGTLLQAIAQYHGIRKFDFEIIFVNDGSTDGTEEIIKSHSQNLFACKLISLSKNYGSHAALRAGFLHARGEYVTCLAADLQIPFQALEGLYTEAVKGNEIIFAVRGDREIGRMERTFSRMYASMMQKYVSRNFPYEGLETFMINAKVKKILNEHIEANSSVFLQLLTIGFKTKFVAIEKVKRTTGSSKWTLGKKVKLFIDSFVSFSYAPIRLVTIIGFVLFIVGILFSAYLILRKILYNDLQSGWPMLISILMLGFGITNISLGIIAEYLWRTLDSSRKRPVFIIDEVIDLKNE